MSEINVVKEVLKEFIKLLDNDIIKKAIDLKQNSNLDKEYQKLIRINEDFKFFAEREITLTHVVCLGHFNTGKSFTINSLLKLIPPDAQITGNRPIDNEITLLIHPKNKSSLESKSEYGTVGIKKKYLDNPILENLVFIDTPGSGDARKYLIENHLEEFTIQADILLYFFNSTVTLSDPDVPVLLAKQKYLYGLETKYILTRADVEFKKDWKVELSDKNFDKDVYQEFIANLIKRFAELQMDENVIPYNLSPSDFIAIDNFGQYGISNLLEYIQNYSLNLTPEKRNAINLFKINSYKRRLAEIRKVFLNEIVYKRNLIKDSINTANSNIANYDDDVRYANNRQSKRFDDHLVRIISAQQTHLEFLDSLCKVSVNYNDLWKDGEINSVININRYNTDLINNARLYMNKCI